MTKGSRPTWFKTTGFHQVTRPAAVIAGQNGGGLASSGFAEKSSVLVDMGKVVGVLCDIRHTVPDVIVDEGDYEDDEQSSQLSDAQVPDLYEEQTEFQDDYKLPSAAAESDSEQVWPARIPSMPSCATSAAAAAASSTGDPMVLHTQGASAGGGSSQHQVQPPAAATAATALTSCGGCTSCGGNASLSIPPAVSAASKVNGSSLSGGNKTGKLLSPPNPGFFQSFFLATHREINFPKL